MGADVKRIWLADLKRIALCLGLIVIMASAATAFGKAPPPPPATTPATRGLQGADLAEFQLLTCRDREAALNRQLVELQARYTEALIRLQEIELEGKRRALREKAGLKEGEVLDAVTGEVKPAPKPAGK